MLRIEPEKDMIIIGGALPPARRDYSGWSRLLNRGNSSKGLRGMGMPQSGAIWQTTAWMYNARERRHLYYLLCLQLIGDTLPVPKVQRTCHASST